MLLNFQSSYLRVSLSEVYFDWLRIYRIDFQSSYLRVSLSAIIAMYLRNSLNFTFQSSYLRVSLSDRVEWILAKHPNALSILLFEGFFVRQSLNIKG